MTINTLKQNSDKTEVIYITSPRARHMLDNIVFTIDAHTIETSDKVRNLGCIMNSTCSMNDNVTAICRSAYFHLKNISKIRSMLTEDAAEKLIHAFISSHLDWCNSLLIGSPDHLFNRLQHIQNAAARVLKRKGKRDSISEILKDLHWLTVRQRCTFKFLTLTQRCLHHQAPVYLSELVSLHKPSRQLRSSSQHLLEQPRVTSKTYGERTFAYAAPKACKSLPSNIREIENYDSFKRQLKTHLFKIAFS